MNIESQEKELLFYKEIIGEYLRYGSVDQLFRASEYNLPISFAGVHRLLDSWGIVKAAGPNTKLSESISFLMLLAQEKIALETLYKRMPPSFQTSLSTLHRILSLIRQGVTRRVGTALLVSPYAYPDMVLIGKDISTPRLDVGKPYGATSLPMGYSKKGESRENSIARVLQQEVFTQMAVERTFPYGVIPENPRALFKLRIADVDVSVFHIAIPDDFISRFSSYKLVEQRLVPTLSILEQAEQLNLRSGVYEAIERYVEGACGVFDSNLNLELAYLPIEG